MPNLTIKKIPKKLYDRLKKSAAENRRSINSEILVVLENALFSSRIDPAEFLARLDSLQATLHYPPLTDDLLRTARHEGRP
jgi:plasmid stability protein